MKIGDNDRRYAYKKVNGKKIRCQYFNHFIYGFSAIPVMIAVIVGVCGLKEGNFNFYEWLSTIGITVFDIVVLTLPVAVLSLLNRHFFGSIVCVINSDGIYHSGGYIAWSSITEVEYVAEPLSRRGYSHAMIRCTDKDVKIKHAPLYMIKYIKKIAPDVKTSFSRGSKIMIFVLSAVALAACVIMCCAK